MELVIERSPKWLHIFRHYSVFLNGDKAGKLSIHKPLYLRSEKELKNISFKIDWVKSREIDLTSFGEEKSINVKVGINQWFVIGNIVGLVLLLLWYVTDVEVFRDLVVLTVMIDFYFYSFGRKDFFKIEVNKVE
ncbi:hypothetical protein [Membranihabitans marinus]|uniref:hypothetical protein n=1 Tax=Membranihabitans marinus TaxID=1227546 RepID=UPI001F341ED5|nr:hypothetical protein [Membranihabitans marinus]